MSRASNKKGKVGERELRDQLNRLFNVDTHRGQQYCGAAGDCDVVGLPGVHVECKRTEALRLWDAITQATSEATEGNTPVVFHRANKKPWIAIVRLDDLPALVQALSAVAK